MYVYDIDAGRKRANVTVGGETSGPELIEAMRALLDDPRFEPTFSIVIDLSELRRTPSIAELRDVAVEVRSRAVTSGARRAIVTRSAVYYELAELFALLTAKAASRYRAFRTLEDAEAWLCEADAD